MANRLTLLISVKVTQSHVKCNERQDASEKLLDHQSYLFFVSFAFNFNLQRYILKCFIESSKPSFKDLTYVAMLDLMRKTAHLRLLLSPSPI